MTMDNYGTADTDAQSDNISSPTQEELEARAAEEDRQLVERAKECYRIGVDTLSRWRQDALEDLEFYAGEQWDANVKGQRDAQGRPALTTNRLPQFVQQVTNEQRQNKSSVTVNPVDSSGDIRTAEVFQGAIRNIEYTSNADAAYASASQSAAITGLGYWDVAAEYEDERSFEQKLTIRRIKNPLSVVMDPGTKEVAGDDARWAIISTDISRAEWEATYPGKEMPKGSGGWDAQGDAAADWVAKDGVRVHEYRYFEEEEDELIDVSEAHELVGQALDMAGLDLSSGTVLASEVGKEFASKLKAAGLQTRPTTQRRARWVKIAADEVIEKGELAGKYLQLVRVVGSEVDINGKENFWGLIRHAKDTQRILNYSVSAETEAIALAPKAPFIAAEGQIEGYEEVWRTANQRPVSVLPYKPTSVGGVAVPPPQRVMAEANIAAITTSRQMASEDLSAVTGIYPTQFGAPAPEQSGKAILARQSQGQTGNFHLSDNRNMAIRYTGRILLDLIPHYYSGKTLLRILGEDGTPEMVSINQEGVDPQTGKPFVQMGAGRYDCTVSSGPSYLSRRQEQTAMMMEFARVYPPIMQIGGDILVRAVDMPDAKVLADRMSKMLPPEIRPPDEEQPPPAVMAQQNQQMQMRLQQMGQLVEQLSQALHNAHDRIDAKEQDNASKERIALINAQTELVKTAAQIKSDMAVTMMNNTAELIHKRLELDGLEEPSDDASTTEQPRGVSAVLKSMQQPPPQPQGAPNVGHPAFASGAPAGAAPGGNPGVLNPGAGGPGFPLGPGGGGG